jgi:hypothetical protein
MKLIIDIPDEIYECYKGRPPRLGDEGMDSIAQSIANGIPYEERPTGEWESLGFVDKKYAWCRCSNCHKTTKIYKDSSNDFCCIADIRKKAIACLYCGADMRGGRK